MLKILERVTKKISSSASIAVTDSVKVEAKKIAQEASPIIFGIGVVAVGLVIFKVVSGKGVSVPIGPTASRIDVTTNNYFFDPSVGAEFVKTMIEK